MYVLNVYVGSLVVQCCSRLQRIDEFNSLETVSGTLRLYYNERLLSVSGFGALSSVGSLEISQNANLTEVAGFQSLELIEGYLQIDHNQALHQLEGLIGLHTISGRSLVAGHALNILYNPMLRDLRWFQNLTQISFGTVHIEGNSALCYAGYPQWAVGGFSARPPGGDQGIDWRTRLGGMVPTWQYSWGGGAGYPTLLVQNNAAYQDCGEFYTLDFCV